MKENLIKHKSTFFVLLIVSLFMSQMSYACGVCFDPNAPERKAYLFITFLLSVLPLTAIVLVIRWIKNQRRHSEHEG